MPLRPRSFLAPNASPMTMDGTITYVVGRGIVAIIDPGSADPSHLDTLADIAGEARRAVIIVTHDHPDHSTGARELAERTGAALLGGPAGPGPADGASVETDEGELVIVRTPGHAPDHISLHWPAASAIFCGDLMMGGLDTAVVAAPEGELGAYLDSLERLRSLDASVIYPAHGPPFTNPDEAIDRYVEHRQDRLRQVQAALDDGARDITTITDRIHGGSLSSGLRPFAEAAVEAYVAYLRATGRA